MAVPGVLFPIVQEGCWETGTAGKSDSKWGVADGTTAFWRHVHFEPIAQSHLAQRPLRAGVSSCLWELGLGLARTKQLASSPDKSVASSFLQQEIRVKQLCLAP